MCRLFALHAGARRTKATFWLLNAPDSLRHQSRRNPDGAGIGVFDEDGRPRVDKHPTAAYQDQELVTAAQELTSTTFLAHVRYASTGNLTTANTQPYEQDGRLFAHNGAFTDVERLDKRLADLGAGDLVGGESDSERMFALITAETRRNGGRVAEAIVTAVGWIADNLPTYSLNLIIATPGELWVLRYPATHGLYVLQRPAGGTSGRDEEMHATTNRIRSQATTLADYPSVLLASERMDGESGWRLLDSGELAHVNANLEVSVTRPFPNNPRHLLTRSDLDPTTATSQHPCR